MQAPLSLRLVVQSVICVSLCGIQGCGTSTQPQAADTRGPSHSATETPGVDSPAPSATPVSVETVAASSPTAVEEKTDQTTTSSPEPDEVSVDETPREPATVAEATRLLDLRTLPLLEGAEVPGGRTRVGSLGYHVKAELQEAFAFHFGQLKESGWRELPDSRLDGQNPLAFLTQKGFVVTLSAIEITWQPDKKGFVMVSINNHGNVLSRTLPVPEGVEIQHVNDINATYVTTAPAKRTRKQCDRLLLDLGWEPYGSARDMRNFKKNAILLSTDVSTHEAQPGKTFLSYRTELLSADLPMPTDYKDPRYHDSQKRVRFDCPDEDIAKVTAFYSAKLAGRDWKPTAEPTRIDDKTVVIYRNPAGDMIELDFQHFRDDCTVSVRHSTALEVAELERRIKEEAQERAAALIAAEDAMPKVALPIPGKATETTQNGDREIDVVVSKGATKGVLEAWQEHFTAAGWQEETVRFGDLFSVLHLRNDEATIKVQASHGNFDPEATIEVRAYGIKLKPAQSVAAFAALGGPPALEPPPAEEVAKAPADIPIPADAQKLSVRPNANLSYEVAGPIDGVAAYFRQTMEQHGWQYDEKPSRIDDKTAILNFKKGRARCGASITDIFDVSVASVTFAGGNMQWDDLKGEKAELDPAVAKFLADGETSRQTAPGILAERIPIPEKAAALQMEADLGMVIYRSELAISEIADFYRKELGKLGWKEVEDETFLFHDENVGRIVLKKGEDSLFVAIQSGETESKTRILIEGEGIVWPEDESDGLDAIVAQQMPEEAAQSESDVALRVSEAKMGKCRGFVQINDEKFELNHALAHQDTESDELATMIFVSEKPFRPACVKGMKVEDLSIFKLRATDHPPSMEIGILGDFVSISCFIGSRSINVSGSEFKNEVVVKDGRLRGKVFTAEPCEFFDDTIQLSVELDVEPMKVAESAAPVTLAASEGYDYPIPFGSDEVSSQSSPYRAVITGSHKADLATMTDFYRRKLAESGWHEKADAAKTTEKAASMSFANQGQVLLVQLRTVDGATEFALAARDVEAAKRDEVVPTAGQAKVVLGNVTEADIVFTIDDAEHKIGAGIGSAGPEDAKKIDIEPGKHTIVIRVPGEKPRTEEVEIEPGTTWGFVALGDEGYIADRIY